jgi:phosphatidate cytidylyltransferase
VGIFQTKRINLKAFGAAALGLLYISLSWGLMIDLGNFIGNTPGFVFYSAILPCAIVFSIWTNDTMAYIVGSLIGRTPLSKISPKKTWEGTIGGILLCIVVIGILFSKIPTDIVNPGYHYKFSNQFWFILAAIAAIFGTIGDLLESSLKRLSNVKDSGKFMPGHGGFLDRFDSMLLAIPAVWLYVYFAFLSD